MNDGPGERGRASTLLAGRLCVGSQVLMVRVRNLSKGGAMLEGVPPLQAGCEVTFDSEKSGEVRGRIAWQRGGRTGVRFDRPVHFKLDTGAVTIPRAQKADFRRPGMRPDKGAKPPEDEDWR